MLVHLECLPNTYEFTIISADISQYYMNQEIKVSFFSTFSASSESSALNSGPLQWEQHNITYRINTVGCREVNYTFLVFLTLTYTQNVKLRN